MIFLVLEFAALLSQHTGLIAQKSGLSPIWDMLLMAFALWIAFKFFSMPSGLWIKPRREVRVVSFLKMAVRGEYRDNPIVQLGITVVGGLLVAIVCKWLGLF